ncbi:hypothetical protein GCM10027515_05410 [Schumannella luteola]|uniref:Uncharacterized protein n=1 Tax=Schumannella luteola TaxID=472059 RepID=A0A852YM75_9MICO|nr:hypothetical protein [Schumannella luteola]NYG98325.1 hypothetical protein [Schumannella luteola]
MTDTVNPTVPDATTDKPLVVSEREAIAAARARVAVDKLRGITTLPWIVELANRPKA